MTGLVQNIPSKLRACRREWNLFNPLSDDIIKKNYLSKEEQIARINASLMKRNKPFLTKDRPNVFIAVRHVNWEKGGLVEPWKDIASITHYDWSLDGYDQNAPFWKKEKKKEFNDKLLAMVRKRHLEKRIDIFFSYLSGRWVYPETIEKIGDLGIITANISFDDKMLYWGYREGGGLSGNAEIANRYDVCITSQDREDVGKYVHSGANPLFLPAAGNPNIFSYLDLDRTIGVSFIGQCYGVRPKYISYLRKKGIDVRTYGLGWPSGSITLKEMNDVYNRSLINLGFSFINSNDKIRGLKGRDYEIPLAGNLYLTSYHPSLEEVYKIGTEIDCYQDREDLLEKVRFYLDHPDKAMKIGYMGRKRCLQDHIWTNRFAELLTILRGPA